jgi:hypothetical protein
MIATFDIETTAFASADVQLTNVNLKLSSGSFEGIGVELPMISQPGEQVALIYKIFPPKDGSTELNSNGSSNRTLTVTVTAIVMISKTCLPTVEIKWKTTLELPPSRPPSRAFASPTHPEPLSMVGHDALIMTGQVAEIRSLSSVADGVSLAISAPDTVYVGKKFRWEVLVVNRSNQVYHLAIIALSKQRKPNLLSAISRPKSTGNQQTADEALAAPLIDDNVLYSIHKNTILEPTDLVCLTPDIKLGYVIILHYQSILICDHFSPLPPSACHDVSLLFLPLTTGSLHFEGLRIVNLATDPPRALTITTLPTILSHPSSP